MINLRPYGKFIQFGSQLGLSMAIPILIGHWADGKYDTSPWFLLLGIFLGITSSVWTVLKLAFDLNEADKQKKKAKEEESHRA